MAYKYVIFSVIIVPCQKKAIPNISITMKSKKKNKTIPALFVAKKRAIPYIYFYNNSRKKTHLYMYYLKKRVLNDLKHVSNNNNPPP